MPIEQLSSGGASMPLSGAIAPTVTSLTTTTGQSTTGLTFNDQAYEQAIQGLANPNTTGQSISIVPYTGNPNVEPYGGGGTWDIMGLDPFLFSGMSQEQASYDAATGAAPIPMSSASGTGANEVLTGNETSSPGYQQFGQNWLNLLNTISSDNLQWGGRNDFPADLKGGGSVTPWDTSNIVGPWNAGNQQQAYYNAIDFISKNAGLDPNSQQAQQLGGAFLDYTLQNNTLYGQNTVDYSSRDNKNILGDLEEDFLTPFTNPLKTLEGGWNPFQGVPVLGSTAQVLENPVTDLTDGRIQDEGRDLLKAAPTAAEIVADVFSFGSLTPVLLAVDVAAQAAEEGYAYSQNPNAYYGEVAPGDYLGGVLDVAGAAGGALGGAASAADEAASAADTVVGTADALDNASTLSQLGTGLQAASALGGVAEGLSTGNIAQTLGGVAGLGPAAVGSFDALSGTTGTNASLSSGINSGISNALGVSPDTLANTWQVLNAGGTLAGAAVPLIENAANAPSNLNLTPASSAPPPAPAAAPLTPDAAGVPLIPEVMENPAQAGYTPPTGSNSTFGGGLGAESSGMTNASLERLLRELGQV